MLELTDAEIRHLLAAMGLYFHSLKVRHGHQAPIITDHNRIVRKLAASLPGRNEPRAD